MPRHPCLASPLTAHPVRVEVRRNSGKKKGVEGTGYSREERAHDYARASITLPLLTWPPVVGYRVPE